MIEIVKLRDEGVGVKEIARRTGFSRYTVRKFEVDPGFRIVGLGGKR